MTLTHTRRSRRTAILLTILITCVVALGAMGAAWAFGWNLAEPTAAATPTPSATNQPYATSADLVAAVKAAGVGCAGFRPPQVRTAGRDNGFCTTDSGGELIITIHADPNGPLNEAAAVHVGGSRPKHTILVGPNWTVYGPDADIDALATKLGGDKYLSPR